MSSRTMDSAPRPERRRSRRPAPRWRWVVAALLVLLVGVSLWVGIRALIARDALLGAVPLVQHAREAIIDGDAAAAAADLDDVKARTAQAAALTSDPVWRVLEVVPLVGVNLTSFREAAAVVDTVAHDALPPLVELGAGLDVNDFAPRDGHLDLEPLIAVQPQLAAATAVMADAAAATESIPTEGTIPQLAIAVRQLSDLITETDELVAAAAGAAEILPSMLGGEGEREYLLLVQNNAELRAAGGIPGALAVISADDGTLHLGEQSGAFPVPADVVVPTLTDEERTLFGDNLGLYMQNVTATPEFARSGELAQAIWRDATGTTVDGVISVDPVALAHVLAVTGPVDVGDGVTLDETNVVPFLLSEVYARYDEPSDQDAFFARAAAAVFDQLLHGGVDARALIGALAEGAAERRILVWSADASEQAIIELSGLDGAPVGSTAERSEFGVYFHDNTESKMSYYLDTAIRTASVECRNDDRPYVEVRVTLTSTAPTDAATRLPDYVTGTRHGLGLVKGQIQTTTFIAAPIGSDIFDVRVNGVSSPRILSPLDGVPMAGVTVTLDPGESAELSYLVLAPEGAPLAVEVEHTPTAFDVPVSLNHVLACPATPTGEPGISALAPTASDATRSEFLINARNM